MPSSRFSRSRKTKKKPAICRPPPPPILIWPPPSINCFWCWLVWVSPTSSGFDFTQDCIIQLKWREPSQDWYAVTAAAVPYAEVILSYSVETAGASFTVVPHAPLGIDVPATAWWSSPPFQRKYDSGIIPADPSPPQGPVTCHFIHT